MALAKRFFRFTNTATTFRLSQKSNSILSESSFMKLRQALPFAASKRHITQEAFEEESKKQISWLTWLTDPVQKSFTPPVQKVTEEMIQEKQELLERVQACYYEKPPQEPGIELFEEAFHLLIKHDDSQNVEALWRLGERQGHEFDDDLLDKIEDYLLDVRERKWYED